MQRNIIGTIFYKLNIDDVPEINNMYPNDGANSFLAFYGEETWNGKVDEGDWYDFEAQIAQLNKEVGEDAAADEDWTRSAESVFDMQSRTDLNAVTDEEE